MEVKKISIEQVVEISLKIPEWGGIIHESNFYIDKIGSSKNIILGCFKDNKLIGYVVAYDRFKDGSIYCWRAAVKPDYRNIGCMGNLFDYLEEWCVKNKYKVLRVKTRNSRRDMLRFLIKRGFLFTSVEERERAVENRIDLMKEL